MTEFWKLEIVDNSGTTAAVMGTENEMKALYEDIKTELERVDGTGAKFVEVRGVFDSADRAKIRRLICVDRISMVTALKM